MNVPLSCPDITELEVEYVTPACSGLGQLSLEARALKFTQQGCRILSSFYELGRNGRKLVEANLKWSKLISEWLFNLSRLQRPGQSAVHATKVELST